jgi:hypothetical protein
MMMNALRLEVLDQDEKVIATHRLGEGLTLLGKSPGATVHLAGKGIAGLHVAIKMGAKPVIMDLGGPTPVRVNGKEALECEIADDITEIQIGDRRVRVLRAKHPIARLQAQPWIPVIERRTTARIKETAPHIRVRLYEKGIPTDVVNSSGAFFLDTRFGIPKLFKMVWKEKKQYTVQLPEQWVALGGRIQVGKEKILNLADWRNPAQLERDIIYRVYAGPYVAEILITAGAPLVVSGDKLDLFPKELRKPMGISIAGVLAVFAIWMLVFGRGETKVEEPYPVYARIQNIPVEKILEPTPTNEPQAGGGAGSENRENTAPQNGGAQSKIAAALTGGLRSLVGNVLSQSTATNTVVAETGIGQAAALAGGGAKTDVGKLAAIGQGISNIAGATKLGALAIAGSGKGFSGGSGMGLGSGAGTGIGSGSGEGIGKGSYKLVEEESIVDGGLDKSVIAAIIQNNLSQIKYCYERQLVAEPDLFGKVVMVWQINAAGTVEGTSVKQTTLNSPPVEQCMASKITGWKFPQPKNGTKVTVSYPFLFKSTK